MSEDDQFPILSPLTQSVTREGRTVQVDIYEDGEGGWLLEVVDEYSNSAIWNETFKSDKDALEEALRTIAEDGIDSLIGAPPSSSSSSPLDVQDKTNTMQIMVPLSDDELDELDSFLMSDSTSGETMMLDSLDGFLTAIVSGPLVLKPSEWLPRVWGPTENDAPEFKTFDEAERITALIFRQLNGIIWSLQHNPEEFEPVFDITVDPDNTREFTDGEMWAYGYMSGINLQLQSWKVLFDDPSGAKVLRPIYLLGADNVTQEDKGFTKTPEQREELSEQIPACVAWIYRFWQPYRQAMAERSIVSTFEREHPKVGRNEICPCGSGKKFKKCCGASTVLH